MSVSINDWLELSRKYEEQLRTVKFEIEYIERDLREAISDLESNSDVPVSFYKVILEMVDESRKIHAYLTTNKVDSVLFYNQNRNVPEVKDV